MSKKKPWTHPPSAVTDTITCPFCEAKARRGVPTNVKKYACREHGWAYKGWWEPFRQQMLAGVPENIGIGDPQWAAEKLWQEVEVILKAVAKARGWPHEDERDLRQAIDRLYKETGNAEYLTLFSVAESLHMNFYEDYMSANVVAAHADDARRLVAKLQALAG